MKARLDYIDKAKGILIILMVIGHIWQSGYVHNVIYAFHMPAFFVISGMLLGYTKSYKKKYIDFVIARVFSFGMPFVFIEILGCLTEIMRHGVTLNIKGYIFNTLILDFNDPNLWFLLDLFLVEMIFAFFIKVTNGNKKSMYIICFILLCISFLSPEGNNYVNTIISTFRYYIYFIIGFYGQERFSKWNSKIFMIAIVAIFAAVSLYGKRANGYLSLENIAFIVSGLCGAYVMLQIGRIDFGKKIEKILSCIGKNTIIIYGTHRFYYSIIGLWMGITDYANTPIGAGLIMIFGVMILEIPTIYIINRWLPFLAGKKLKKNIINRNNR